MNKILRFEFIKLFSSAAFYICGIFILFIGMSSYGALAILDILTSPINQSLVYMGYSGLDFMLHIISISNFPLLIGILCAISICTEYTQKTFKNVWSRGCSRTMVYASKCIVNTVAALIYGTVVMGVAFILGSILWGVGDGFGPAVVVSVIIQLFSCVAYAILFTMVAFVFKKTALAVVICVAGPSLMSIGTQILDYILMYKNIDFNVSRFLISNNLSKLAMYSVRVSRMDCSYDLAFAFLVAAAFLIVSLILGWLGMRKDEI